MAKGKCINFGKPCHLAIDGVEQDADPSNFTCSECGQPLDPVKGTKKKDNGGSNTGGGNNSNKKKIIAICVFAAAAIGGGTWWATSQGDKADENVPEVVEPVKEPVAEPVAASDTTGSDTISEPEKEPENGPVQQPEPQPANPNYLNNYALAYGTYSGPAVDGVPNGPGGTVKVTKAYQLDLKAGGEMLDLQAGDQIVNCKFRNGKIVQGFLKRKNGQGRNFNIGI